MGYDLVTWSPRVGAAGDDVYNVPGAIKLDGTMDTGNASRIERGSNAFSTTPTIAEINASSGLNQVIGLINRRIRRYNTLFGLSIFNRINTVRLTEGFASYVFPTAEVATGKAIRGTHLAHMRKALRISGVLTSGNIVVATGSRYSNYVRFDNPYLTTESESYPGSGEADGSAAGSCGKSHFGLSVTRTSRQRYLFQYAIPDWATAADSANFHLDVNTEIETLEAVTTEVYRSNTDDFPAVLTPAYGGSAYNTNNLVGSAAAPSSNDFAVAAADVVARAGGRLCFIVGTANEIASAGLGVTDGIKSALSTFHVGFSIDFGA